MRSTPFALVFALVSGALISAATPDQPTQPASPASTLAQLNREHLDTLNEILKIRETSFKLGRSSQEDVDAAKIKLIEAEIKYTNDTQLRHELCNKLLKILDTQLSRINFRNISGISNSDSFLEHKSNLLESKINTIQILHKTLSDNASKGGRK